MSVELGEQRQFDPHPGNPGERVDRLVAGINGLEANESVRLPDGVEVQAVTARYGGGTRRELHVTNWGGPRVGSTVKLDARSAAEDALTQSARNASPDSLGGRWPFHHHASVPAAAEES